MIIDGNSLLYRAFYALPLLSKNGVYTNAVYGFLRMLLGVYRAMDPEYMAVSFDKDKHTFRMELYDEYKGTRKPAPPELVPQFALIRDVLRVMGIAQYELSGFEGDDILGTLAARYEGELPVKVITGDRDALQLVNDRTTVFLTQRGISDMAEMTPGAVQEKYGITPEQVDHINAHGTGTHMNDACETAAIHAVFGEHAKQLTVVSTKSMTGHLLGGAGGIEAVFTALALRDQFAPPTIHYQQPDPECDLDYVPNTGRAQAMTYALSNSLGFGGHNACIALRRWEG